MVLEIPMDIPGNEVPIYLKEINAPNGWASVETKGAQPSIKMWNSAFKKGYDEKSGPVIQVWLWVPLLIDRCRHWPKRSRVFTQKAQADDQRAGGTSEFPQVRELA